MLWTKRRSPRRPESRSWPRSRIQDKHFTGEHYSWADGAVTKCCWVFSKDRTQPFQIPETVSFLKGRTTLWKSGWEVAFAVWGGKKNKLLSWCPATPCSLSYLAFTTECGPQGSNNPFSICSFPPEKGAMKRGHLQLGWCNQLASLVTYVPLLLRMFSTWGDTKPKPRLQHVPGLPSRSYDLFIKHDVELKLQIQRMLRWMPRCFLLGSRWGVCGRREQQSLGTACTLGRLEWSRKMGWGFCALRLMYYSLLGADCFWLHASADMWRGRLR